MICSTCKRELPAESFRPNTLPGRTRQHDTYCRECRTAYERNRSLEAKKKAIALKGGASEICGVRGLHPAAYDFHHSDPAEKEGNIAHLLQKSFAKALAELAKTVLWCANCHRTFHAEETEKRHGAGAC